MEKFIFIFIVLISCLLIFYTSKEVFYQCNIKYQLYKNLSKTKNGSKYIPKNIFQILPNKKKLIICFK